MDNALEGFATLYAYDNLSSDPYPGKHQCYCNATVPGGCLFYYLLGGRVVNDAHRLRMQQKKPNAQFLVQGHFSPVVSTLLPADT